MATRNTQYAISGRKSLMQILGRDAKYMTQNTKLYNKEQYYTILTLKWSRGVPMDPKISFRASAQKRRIS